MKCPACNTGWKKCLSTCQICECLQRCGNFRHRAIRHRTLSPPTLSPPTHSPPTLSPPTPFARDTLSPPTPFATDTLSPPRIFATDTLSPPNFSPPIHFRHREFSPEVDKLATPPRLLAGRGVGINICLFVCYVWSIILEF